MTETRIPRRTRRHRRTPVLLLLCAAVLVAGLLAAVVMSLRPVKAPDPGARPHEGQVYINDGASMVWHTPLEGVPCQPVWSRTSSSVTANASATPGRTWPPAGAWTCPTTRAASTGRR